MFRHARGKQPGYQKGTEFFPTKESPSCIMNASDLQVDISDAKDAQHNAKCWEKETGDRTIA